MKKIFFILLFLSSCGYQPLYTNQNQKNFIYEKVTLIGDKVLNRKIISALNVKEKKDSDLIDEIIFDIKKITLETSKDEKGQVASYRTSISLNLTIKNQNNVLKTNVFTEDFSYNTMSNKFDLVEYQREIENNLLNKIIDNLIIYLNL
tara:strand:+ start:711 stop:1154 length:444 start_codon:yes stop_codon:yes gene_type:complete